MQHLACFCGVIRSSLNFAVAQSQAHGYEGKQGNSNTLYSDCVLPNRGALASLAKLQAVCSLSLKQHGHMVKVLQ